MMMSFFFTEQLVSMERCLVLVVLMLSLCMATQPVASNSSADDDKAALLALKATITSDPFVILSNNWSHQTPYCDWIGVTCNAKHQRVTQLNLFKMGLIGTIPKEIGHLSFLSTFNISANSFHGHIPDSIGFLTKLQTLDLSYNALTGNIPATLYNVSSLRLVDLGNNHLSGTLPGGTCDDNFRLLQVLTLSANGLSGQIPSSLHKCMELRILDLGDNEFHGSIPPQIGNSSKLEQLILHGNNLTGDLPWTIFNISSLVILNLQANEISGLLPNDLCYSLPKLEVLRVGINQIHGEIPPGLPSCRRLKVLSLSANQLSGRIPSGIYNMSSLEVLQLAKMELLGNLPNEIGKLSMLRDLRLFDNRLTGMIPPSIGNLSALEIFVVADNNLYGNIPLEFGKLSSLQGLSLRSNNFSGNIPSSIFNNISGLQIIEMSFNKLSGNLQQSLRNWMSPSLIELDIQFNLFTGSIPSSISNASNLALLDLGNNMFSGHVPLVVENLHQLQYFAIQENQITNDPSANDLSLLTSLLKCKDLHTIVLSVNPFNTPLPNLLDGGNASLSLKIFYGDYCGFKGSIPTGISNFSNLYDLDLGNNMLLGSFPKTLGRLQRLQGLKLGNNELEGSIPKTLCYLNDLSEMDLRWNEFSGEIPSCLGNISSLRKIYLGSNLLTSAIPLGFWNNKDILMLDLSNNFLSAPLSPEIGSMHSIITLDLSGNKFSGEIPDAIGQLQNLMNLFLSSNRLRGPIPQSFGSLISLQQLDLSNNSLSGGIPKSMEKLKDLMYLNMSFNELSGKIPDDGPFAKFSMESFMGNKELCGASRFHVMECKEVKEKPRNTPIFHKYVLPSLVSVVVFVAILLVLLLTFWKRNKRREPRAEDSLDVALKRISYYEILRATKDFDESNSIGRGSFSSVLKGTFAAGLVAAVKVFNLDVQDSIRSFEVECQVLRNIRHRNLVKVITSCSNLDFKALILEYMPNGSLDKWLYSHNYFLDIYQRLGIMMDVANALEYLHHGHSFPVVHCDLKPGNILLDQNMVAHVGDFGIAKLLEKDKATKQTKTMGTVGYMAPEYGSAGIISTMGDVYSFGILLMEVFTRKKPTDEMFQGDFSMRRWVSDSLPDAIMQIVDCNLLTTEESGQEIEQCFLMAMELALECTTDIPEERMSMKDVIVRLKHTQQKLNQNVSVSLVIN